MRANSTPTKPRQRTFTEDARRAQIVEAAIETIAEEGYRRSSLARIAKRAGLSSTGHITYYFSGKDQLMAAVVEEIFGRIGRFMSQEVAEGSSASAALRSYIEANVAFVGRHRSEMKALLDVFLNGAMNYDADTDGQVVSFLESTLKRGQESGEFRSFDPIVMATTIQRAIDGLPFLLERAPEMRIDSYASELVTLFDLATRKEN